MALLQKGYLGATPLFRETVWYEASGRKFISTGSATATANSSAHTKGAWQQVIASTAANGSWLHVNCTAFNASATNTASLMDIAIGAAGSETAIASNIAVGGASGTYFTFPLQIPSGSRLSARIQSIVTGGKTGGITMHVVDAGDYATSPTSVDVIGTDATTSKGTDFAGSSGTWVEAVASTTRAYRAVTFVPSAHNDDLAAITVLPEIGVGASAAEISFAISRFNTGAGPDSVLTSVPFPIDPHGRLIPAGSRLAVQHNIAANPTKYGFCLIGIP
jgi:hypothetical protein